MCFSIDKCWLDFAQVSNVLMLVYWKHLSQIPDVYVIIDIFSGWYYTFSNLIVCKYYYMYIIWWYSLHCILYYSHDSLGFSLILVVNTHVLNIVTECALTISPCWMDASEPFDSGPACTAVLVVHRGSFINMWCRYWTWSGDVTWVIHKPVLFILIVNITCSWLAK